MVKQIAKARVLLSMRTIKKPFFVGLEEVELFTNVFLR
jgi:hypothetical protein